ncbi:MAG: thiol-disulfide oxidoreductase DCC family protein [Thermoanaerobaculia bacterium]
MRGTVLYDDECGFCRRWVLFWRATLERRGYSVAPLQGEWAREKLGLAGEELVEDVRLLFPDGRITRGANVYREVMRRIWWLSPVWLLSAAPGLRSVFDRGYRVFASHRHRFSRGCGLAPGVHPDSPRS